MDEQEQLKYLEELIEVKALDRSAFLRVRECLTRIGVLSISTNTLWQSCHIFHKRGRYFVVHYKQLFALDGKLHGDVVSDEDLDRVEKVAILLERWGLVEPLVELDDSVQSVLNIIPYKKRGDYNLRAKYTIGGKHERSEDNNRSRPGDN